MIPYYLKPGIAINSRDKVVFLLFSLFCLFPFYSPDTYAYYEYFRLIRQNNTFGIPLEKIYFDIASAVDSFLLFRVIVWGGACVCTWYTISVLGIRKGAFYLFFIGLFILKFSYARVFISFALIFLGMAVYYKDNSSLRTKILGVLIVICAYWTHKSAIFGVALALFTILIPSFNKNALKIILILYPVLIILSNIIITHFFDIGFDEGDLAQNTARHYLETDRSAIGIGKMIENILTRYSFYVAIYIYIKMIFKGHFKRLPLRIQKFATVGFLLIIFATVFAFDLGYNTRIYYYRLLHFSIIPVSVFLGYLYQSRYKLKLLRITWKIGFLGCIYAFLYTLYNALVS